MGIKNKLGFMKLLEYSEPGMCIPCKWRDESRKIVLQYRMRRYHEENKILPKNFYLNCIISKL